MGKFAAYAKNITETEGSRVLEGVFIKRRYVDTGKGSGGDSVGPSVGRVVQGRKKKDKQERSKRKNKGLSSSS